MHEWEQVKTYLEKQDIAQEDISLVEEFLRHFDFTKRQQFMGIFWGWPDKIGVFIDILKKKKALAKTYDKNLAEEILNIENKEIENLMKEISK